MEVSQKIPNMCVPTKMGSKIKLQAERWPPLPETSEIGADVI